MGLTEWHGYGYAMLNPLSAVYGVEGIQASELSEMKGKREARMRAEVGSRVNIEPGAHVRIPNLHREIIGQHHL